MKIPQQVLDELVLARKRVQDLSQAFGDAIKAQAEKHKLKPAALRAYVCALADDKLIELGQLADQLTELIDEEQPDLFRTAEELSVKVAEHIDKFGLTDPETGEVILASRVNE